MSNLTQKQRHEIFTLMYEEIRSPQKWLEHDAHLSIAENLTEKLSNWIVSQEEQKSYSELIIEGNEAKKTCGQCGQLCVAYKEKFRKGWVTCLHAMQEHGEMTYKQLADVLVSAYDFNDKTANSMARSFCMARHWLVIEKTGKSIGRCPVYRITSYGREVVANTRMVFKFLWLPARKVEMDLSGLPVADSCFASEILPDDPNDLANKALHVEESLPAF